MCVRVIRLAAWSNLGVNVGILLLVSENLNHTSFTGEDLQFFVKDSSLREVLALFLIPSADFRLKFLKALKLKPSLLTRNFLTNYEDVTQSYSVC